MVTLQATTGTELSCTLLFDQLMHLYTNTQSAISQATHEDTQLRITFSDWATTVKARDFLERFGTRYSILNVEWL